MGKIRGKLFYKKKLFLSFCMSRKCQLNYDPRTYLLCREGNAAEGNVNPDIAPLSTLYPPSCNLKLYLQNRFCFYASALSVREGSIYFSSKWTSPLVWTPSHPHSLYWTNLDSNSHSICTWLLKDYFNNSFIHEFMDSRDPPIDYSSKIHRGESNGPFP